MSEMTTALALPDPDAIERAGDAVQFVELALERAKTWLHEALDHGDIDQIVELKSQAEAIRAYTAQKQYGADVVLTATEIVRRAERGLGVAIRRGQEAGEIATQETGWMRREAARGNPVTNRDKIPMSVTDVLSKGEWSGNDAGIKDLADDVTDEQFEQAIEAAKAEKNLSRANVVRKTQQAAPGHIPVTRRLDEIRDLAAQALASHQIATRLGVGVNQIRSVAKANGIEVPADAVVGRTRLFDSNRIVQGTVTAVDGIDGLLDHIDFSTLDGEHLHGWVVSLSDAIRSLTTLRNNLKKEMTSRDEQ